MSYDPTKVSTFQSSAVWSALARTELDAASVGTWDRDLLREPRILVPIDVQAYVVPAGGDPEGTVRLLCPLSPGAPSTPAVLVGPPPFDPGTARAGGVHLHWALPDSLLRGTLRDPRPRTETVAEGEAAPPPTGPDNAGGGLGLAALPDRWAVLRLVAAESASIVAVRGWVIDAASGTAWDLAAYPSGAPLPTPPGQDPPVIVPREGLTGAAGGSLAWTGGYDAAFGRFAWHDPLDDLIADPTLGGALPGGPTAGKASYLVVGWWSDPELDPLDRVRTEGGLAERLGALAWRLLPGGGTEAQEREGVARRSATVGLEAASRWADVRMIEPLSVADTPGGATPAAGATAQFAVGSLSQFVAGGLSQLAAETKVVVPARPVGVEASALLHGAVIGVPVSGEVPGPDLRPATAATRLALGDSLDELVATLSASGLGLNGEERATLERLLSAFSSRLLARIGSPDGLADVDEARHVAAFVSADPAEPPETDRVRTGRARIPARTRRTGVTPGAGTKFDIGKVTLDFAERKTRGFLVAESRAQTIALQPKSATTPSVPRTPAPTDPREAPGETVVERPAPRRYVPADPALAVAGAGRNLRHGGDGRWSTDGRLGVRRPSHVAEDYAGVVRGAEILATLGSGALPPEALGLAREVLMLSPHLAQWLARAGAAGVPHLDVRVIETRLFAEMALRYDDSGAYTAASGFTVSASPQPIAAVTGAAGQFSRLAAERIRRHSLLAGVEPDPVGITSWAQPWVPLWLEYELGLAIAAAPDELAGWRLGAVDQELVDPETPPATPDALTVRARVPLTDGPADAMSGALAGYVREEDERDRAGIGEVDAAVRDRLHALGRSAGSLDLVGAVLDGVRAALMGLPVGSIRARDASGALVPPTPTGLPRLVAGGTVTLTRARLVDAFGRTLDLDPAVATVAARLEVPGTPATLRRTPRLSAPSRCRLRFVGATASAPAAAVPARVDEIDRGAEVNPVAGFLLPDHVDESIELFTVDGTPLGELLVEPVGGGVIWEPAPGQPLPADAPPHAGLSPEQAVLGHLAAGLVAADARARSGIDGDPEALTESALSACLRAIDTTLWTVDPVSSVGSSAIGAIVGRPVAVVAATLLLDVAPDLDDLTLDAAGRAAREAAFRALARLEFPVRLGELTRTDDGLLGYFIDGDFTKLHLVDRAVADLAREAGRGRGHLGTWGETPDIPDPDRIRHPYLHAEDEVLLRPGIPRLVTLLMLPGAAVHVTSGVVPRQKIRLSRAWFAAGLERLSPSVRVGPVLIDPGEVRLPLVAALGDKQTLTTREGVLGWRNDAILAATQSAVLPDRTNVLREGWIRVTPQSPDEGVDEAEGGTL